MPPLLTLRNLIDEYQQPRRKALSALFPILAKPAVFTKRCIRSIYNRSTLPQLIQHEPLQYVIARHSSPLYRKLGDSDHVLQHNKIINLTCTVPLLDGLIIPAGALFSLWDVIGKTDESRGFVEGMLISNGTVSRGVGGGLCQLSNFLFWILLHAQTEIVERHHHSVDVFPDSGRTLPFGSGATIFYNYLDLKMKNTSKHPLQIKLWLTDTHLKGQIRSDAPAEAKFHITEKNHCFIQAYGRYFRYNELYRETYVHGIQVQEEKIITNCAPVVYPVTDTYISDNKYVRITL